MEETKQQLGNLKINGSGSASGGLFNEVKINGSGKLTGDLECRSFEINGSCKGEGDLKTLSGEVKGSATFSGSMVAERFKTSGSVDFKGDGDAGALAVDGHMHFGGSLHAEEIKIRGALTVGGDCQSEMFDSRGTFKIGGLLNAGTIEVNLSGKCEAREIGGGKINISKKGFAGTIERFIKSLFNQDDELMVDSIEGDDIYLEFTTARIIRGTNVVIGRGCQIGTVEYKGVFRVEENGVVREHVQV
ncbi:polymer-forming cytoskeletal protein [Gorillibacterium massiliense]|uniref:polymer-forming cytoskeletal protein n=1 Tax=Gorillibacterium massiliense TaxID=1280390 RepID=UPI0004BAA3C9|nr:polymer-forming cytoskeletal protein [Gorillibacterium massiliense]